jgi:hypothetical protein
MARAITAVPMHAFVGAILGYYVGRAHLPGHGNPSALWGLLAALMLHGLYDFPLLTMQAMARGGIDLENPANGLLVLGLVAFALFVLALGGNLDVALGAPHEEASARTGGGGCWLVAEVVRHRETS